MKIDELVNIIAESVIPILNESWYGDTATPLMRKNNDQRYEVGSNPLYTDNGNHSTYDNLIQPSTIDFNGENFDAEPIVLSDNKFLFYKLKNFNSDTIQSSLDFFGKGADAEKNFRKAIDTLYGASKRNRRNVMFRTISCGSKPVRRNSFVDTFWEYSFDGETWYIMKPNPTQTMKQSKLVKKI